MTGHTPEHPAVTEAISQAQQSADAFIAELSKWSATSMRRRGDYPSVLHVMEALPWAKPEPYQQTAAPEIPPPATEATPSRLPRFMQTALERFRRRKAEAAPYIGSAAWAGA